MQHMNVTRQILQDNIFAIWDSFAKLNSSQNFHANGIVLFNYILCHVLFQGTNKAMNWLKELVEDSQSSLDVLPVSCLCEFLIMGYQERGVVSEAGDEAGPSHRSHFKRKHRGKEKVSIAYIPSYFS